MNDHELMEAMFEAITGLRSDVTGIKADMIDMKADMADMKAELKADIRKINIQLENDIVPRLNTIEACYTDTYRRYISETDDIQQLKVDVSILKLSMANLVQSA